MIDYFIPTSRNNYRAKLLGMPALTLMVAAILLVNSFVVPITTLASQGSISLEKLLEVHNLERRKQGLPILKLSSGLTTSAQLKASAMLNNDCWSHYCPNGTSPWEFFASAGYDYKIAGENLAEGFNEVQDVFIAWMNSPTHKDNILKAEYEEIGFGIVHGHFQGKRSNTVIVVHFGTPQPKLDPLNFPVTLTSDGLAAPIITNPTEGAAYNTQTITVSGNAPDASEVSIYESGELWDVTDANQGIFTYKRSELPHGEYSVSAISAVGVRKSPPSKPINFEVDLKPDPVFEQDLIPVYRQDQSVIIHASKPRLDRLIISSPTADYSFEIDTDRIWKVTIPIRELSENTTLKISTLDLAGNPWQGEIPTLPLVREIEKLSISGPGSSDIPLTLLGGVTRSQINVGVIIFLMSLFFVDFLALSRTGLTAKLPTTRFHFGLMLVILIITLTGALSGHILDGISRL